ncbi:MAG: serine O-acetyltransferase [Bryobacterales bacterium]|nr:serine O-acetyltransferase [Bryobacterales bacterium]
MFRTIREQIETIRLEDPAAKSILEILFCYPGMQAILFHKASHWLYLKRRYVLARMVSQTARFLTGIEIHPGATIGRRLFIDHGMGIVIGETTEIGDDVLLYQGVTLGGTGNERGKRHPTLGNEVVVGAGAKVLGNITLGDCVKVGAGSVVVKNVPPNSTVVGIPGRVVKSMGEKIATLAHGDLPDPEGQRIDDLMRRLQVLELHVKSLEADHKAPCETDAPFPANERSPSH